MDPPDPKSPTSFYQISRKMNKTEPNYRYFGNLSLSAVKISLDGWHRLRHHATKLAAILWIKEYG
jgi:hypothetical protein